MPRKRKPRPSAVPRKPKQRDSKVDRLLAIAKDWAAHMKEPFKSMDIGQLLYDEKGLLRSD